MELKTFEYFTEVRDDAQAAGLDELEKIDAQGISLESFREGEMSEIFALGALIVAELRRMNDTLERMISEKGSPLEGGAKK